MAIKKGVDEMTLSKPYFMRNTDWYKFDEEKFKYVLTDKAPKNAVESYNEFYEKVEYQNSEPHKEDS